MRYIPIDFVMDREDSCQLIVPGNPSPDNDLEVAGRCPGIPPSRYHFTSDLARDDKLRVFFG